MRINIIGNMRAGKGLAQDAHLLGHYLGRLDHRVHHVHFRDREAPRAHLSLHLEVCAPLLMQQAPKNVLIPNIEFYTARHDGVAYDAVWTKTQHAQRILSARLPSNVQYLGFVSADLMRADIERHNAVLHVPGGSAYRGTGAVIECWRRYGPSLPPLRVVSRLQRPSSLPKNVRWMGRVPDRESFVRLMNEHLIHLLPSAVEGYGHTLWEARSVGALLLTTDAPPMNEWGAFAFIPPLNEYQIAPNRIVQAVEISPEAIRQSVDLAVTADEDSRTRFQNEARSHWETEANQFEPRLEELLSDVNQSMTHVIPAASRPVVVVDTPSPVDFFATKVHYMEHLMPVYRALPPSVRGTWYATPNVARIMSDSGIVRIPRKNDSVRFLRKTDRLVVTSASQDQGYVASAGRHSVFLEHGAGQSYDRPHTSHAGHPGRKGVVLFLVPGSIPAKANRASYPEVPVVEIGCPKLDPWLDGSRRLPQNDHPIVALSFHWDCTVFPETRSAFKHYSPHLKALVERLAVEGVELVGHAHPRAQHGIFPRYRRLGIRPIERFDEILSLADLYVVDNSSTGFEFAATGRPIVWLNAPWYRRRIEVGLRFWSHATLGHQVNDGDGLFDAILDALKDTEERRRERDRLLASVYGVMDGTSAQQAAAWIVAVSSQYPPRKEGDPVRVPLRLAKARRPQTTLNVPVVATNGASLPSSEEDDMPRNAASYIFLRALNTFKNRQMVHFIRAENGYWYRSRDGKATRGNAFATFNNNAGRMWAKRIVEERHYAVYIDTPSDEEFNETLFVPPATDAQTLDEGVIETKADLLRSPGIQRKSTFGATIRSGVEILHPKAQQKPEPVEEPPVTVTMNHVGGGWYAFSNGADRVKGKTAAQAYLDTVNT